MTSVVCTLFENHYHYGVAALTNSLYRQGFRGPVYAGYRGPLPSWARVASENSALGWAGATTLEVADGLKIHFLPLDTSYLLTNYKPQFMIRLLAGPAKEAGSMFYFDPDIVVKCTWSFFENWVTHGVALVHEIISNDMPLTHPKRKEWEKVILKLGRTPTRQVQSYINGGFCGVSSDHFEFLEVWAKVMETAIHHYHVNPFKFMPFDKPHFFYAGDQDALNITAMCSDAPISELGPEGMDFIHGGWTMSHAVGSPKPWKKKFFWHALGGYPPSLADRSFWQYVHSPIPVFSQRQVIYKKVGMLASAFIGRFYHR